MPRSSSYLLTVFSLVLGFPLRADDEAPRQQGMPFETLMEVKGLKRFGLSYILKDTEERDRHRDKIGATLVTLENQFAPLRSEKSRLESALKSAEDAVTRDYHPSNNSKETPEEEQRRKESARASDRRARDSASNALAVFESAYGASLRGYEAEKRRLQGEIQSLVAQTTRIYNDLWYEPQVRAAFRARNFALKPKVVLGPIGSPAEYRLRIRNDDIDLLRERGVVFEPTQKRWALTAEVRVVFRATQAQKLLDQLNTAETRARGGGKSERVKVREKRDAVAADLAKASPLMKQKLIALLKVHDDLLKKLPPDDAEPDADAQRRVAEVVALRKDVLAAIDALRKAVDEAPREREKIEADNEIRSTLEELKNTKSAITILPAPQYAQAISTLARLEKTVRVEHVPCGVGRDGEATVMVAVNGGQPVAMAVDPEAKAKRTLLPASLADAIGLTPARDAPEIAVTLAEGETIKARRSPPGSVRIGGLSVEGITCLVFPDDIAGRVRPVLGMDVLDRFAWDLPFGGKELILTQVVPALAKEAKLPLKAAGR